MTEQERPTYTGRLKDEGRYDGTITEVAVKQFPKGARGIVVAVQADLDDGTEQVEWTGWLTKQTAIDNSLKRLAALGATKLLVQPPDFGCLFDGSLVGKRVEVTIEIERDEKYGDRARVRYLDPVGGGIAKPVSLDELNLQFAVGVPSGQAANTEVIADEDTPF